MQLQQRPQGAEEGVTVFFLVCFCIGVWRLLGLVAVACRKAAGEKESLGPLLVRALLLGVLIW